MKGRIKKVSIGVIACLLCSCLFGCGHNSIVGTWYFDDGPTAVFDKDGTLAIDVNGSYFTGDWSEYKVEPVVQIDGKKWDVYLYPQDESDPEDDICFYVNDNEMYLTMQRYGDLLKGYDANDDDFLALKDGKNAFEMLDAQHATRGN